MASHELNLTAFMDNWLEWRAKLIKFGQVEYTTRPVIKKLLQKLDTCDDLLYPEGLFNVFTVQLCDIHCTHSDAKDGICLELLSRLLYPRKQSKLCLLKNIKVCLNNNKIVVMCQLNE